MTIRFGVFDATGARWFDGPTLSSGADYAWASAQRQTYWLLVENGSMDPHCRP